MKVKVINRSGNPLPAYATPLAAGLDVRADNAEPIVLKPLESEFVLDLLQESALGRFFTSGSALSDLFGIGANLRNLG